MNNREIIIKNDSKYRKHLIVGATICVLVLSFLMASQNKLFSPVYTFNLDQFFTSFIVFEFLFFLVIMSHDAIVPLNSEFKIEIHNDINVVTLKTSTVSLELERGEVFSISYNKWSNSKITAITIKNARGKKIKFSSKKDFSYIVDQIINGISEDNSLTPVKEGILLGKNSYRLENFRQDKEPEQLGSGKDLKDERTRDINKK